MDQLEEEVLASQQNGHDIQTKVTKILNDKQKREQVQKSIDIMKKKFEAKSNLDILRYFDRLGIDLIINNQTLYEQFCERVISSMNEKKTYYQPSEQIISKFKTELAAKNNSWNKIKKLRRESKISMPSVLSLEKVSFITQNLDSIFQNNKSQDKSFQSSQQDDTKANQQLRAIEELFSPKRKIKIKNFVELNKSSILTESSQILSKFITNRRQLRKGSQVIESNKNGDILDYRRSHNPSPNNVSQGNRFSSIYEFFNKSKMLESENKLFKKKRQNNSQIIDDFSRIIDDCADYSTHAKDSDIVSKIDEIEKQRNIFVFESAWVEENMEARQICIFKKNQSSK
eukprot:403348688